MPFYMVTAYFLLMSPFVFFHNRSLKKCVLFKTRLILNEKRLFNSNFEFVKLKRFSKRISLPPHPAVPKSTVKLCSFIKLLIFGLLFVFYFSKLSNYQTLQVKRKAKLRRWLIYWERHPRQSCLLFTFYYSTQFFFKPHPRKFFPI